MKRIYDPYIYKRACEGRIYLVNAQMPFEYFIDCFNTEQPWFFVSQLDDGRIAITPNATLFNWNPLQAGFGPQDILPREFEYVTIRNATYPVIFTAHPVGSFGEWFKQFERMVVPFATQTLADFVSGHVEDYLPVSFGGAFPDVTESAYGKGFAEKVVH